MLDGRMVTKSSAASVRLAWPIAFAAALLALMVSFLLVPPAYQSNDDPVLQHVFAGDIGTEPTPYVSFVNYLYSLGVCALFRLLPGVPWWTVLNIFAVVLSLALCNRTLVCLLRARVERASVLQGFVVAFALDFCLGMTFISRLQFTTIASLLVSSALFSTCVWRPGEDDWRGGVGSWCTMPALLAVWGFALRRDSGLMGLLFWGIVVMGKLVWCGSGSLVMRIKAAGGAWRPLALSAIVAAALLMAHAVAYSSGDLQRQANYASVLASYSDYPKYTYQEDSSAYNAVGWNEELWQLTDALFVLDDRVSTDALTELSEHNDAWIANLVENPASTLKYRARDVLKPVPMAYASLWLSAVLVVCLIPKKNDARLTGFLVAIAAAILVVYLLVRGRLPERAFYAVLIPSAMALASVFLGRGDGEADVSSRSSAPFVVSAALMAMLSAVVLRLGGMSVALVLAPTFLLSGMLLCKKLHSRVRGDSPQNRGAAGVAVAAICCVQMAMPAALAFYECGPMSQYQQEQIVRQSNVNAFYGYVEEHDETLFIFSSDSGLTPWSIWQMRWPKNQISWGGWRFSWDWQVEGLEAAGFEGLPKGPDLFSEDIRFVSMSEDSTEAFLAYLQSLDYSASLELEAEVGEGVEIYCIVRSDSEQR